jgi:hypothetical protein
VLLIILGFLLVVIALPLYFFFHVEPTCFDNKQNGDETGVDCGGSCTTLCGAESLPLILKGDPRVLKVASTTYEVVAHVQNPNATGKIMRANYVFKLYEASSTIPARTIMGSTYIPQNMTFAVFEGPFDMGDKSPTRATLEWTQSSLNWVKDTTVLPDIFISDNGVENASTSPRINATVKNRSLYTLSTVYLVALVSDDTGTIQAASKTYIDHLDPNQEERVAFTWPGSFTFTPASVNIIPVVLPDQSYIR